MTAPRHLLGFVRAADGFTPLYDASPYFFDITRNSRCVAVVVPLAVLDVGAGWVRSADAPALPPQVLATIERGGVFVTSTEDRSGLHVLMYPRADNDETSRGGVLLVREGSAYAPLVAHVDGRAYLVELKGCGCPRGGFAGYHLRRTSPKGCHFHVAGALGHAGAWGEYSGLEQRRASAERIGYPLELRAAAVARYDHGCARRGEPLGQVVRLAPSSLRASFTGNPAFDRTMQRDDAVIAHNLGREGACLLQCDPPRIHRNPSLNNLCHVAERTYVLSDIEAAPPLTTGYEALDYDDSVVLDQHRHVQRSVGRFAEILAGMRAAPGEVAAVLQGREPADEAALGRIVYAELVAPRVYRARAAGAPGSASILAKNFDHLRAFMPDPFFAVSWREWIAAHLVPMFEQKLAILAGYRELARDDAWPELAARLYGDAASDAAVATLRRLLREHTRAVARRLDARCAIGAYAPDRVLESLYVDVPAAEQAWTSNHLAVTTVLERVREASTTGRWDVAAAPALACAGAAAWSPADAVFPHHAPITTHLRNERRLLEGVAPVVTDGERAAFDRTFARLRALEDELVHTPEALHAVIVRGRDAFVDHLTLPYGVAATRLAG